MFFVNLVRLLLLVGVLYESGVDAAEHQREQPSDLRATIVSVFDAFIKFSHQHDEDAVATLVHPDAHLLVNGLPQVDGKDDVRYILELVPEKAYRIENIYKEVQAMDENANYVYVVLHFDFFNESGENYIDGNGLFIFRRTPEGYKYYIFMYNTHNQLTES